jgi:sugar phosphate isomerase/epimerase
MYTAIFSRTYAMKNVAEVIGAAAMDGYEGIQANLSSAGLASLPDTVPPGVAVQFGQEARARGIRLASLSGTYNMVHPDAKVREASRARFQNVVSAAREMGAPIVSLCTGSRDPHDMWKFHAENDSVDAWEDLRSELEFALRVAQEVGVRLAIEPEPANVIRDAVAAKRILNEMASSHLGILLDAANLLTPETLSRQHEVIEEATGLLGDALLLAHAKDIDASGKVVAPGEGEVNLMAFTKALRRAGYDDALIAHGFAAEKAGVAAKVLQRIIGESA